MLLRFQMLFYFLKNKIKKYVLHVLVYDVQYSASNAVHSTVKTRSHPASSLLY